jgi:hypothetical protein
MIVIENLMDEAAYPIHADIYRRLVQAALGTGIDDHYRLWFIDHAMHGGPNFLPGQPDVHPARSTRIVDYDGVIQQALRDVVDWVEKGLVPPASTTYEVIDNQVFVPSTAQARRGIQPVATLAANGGIRAEVAVGEVVEFHGTAEVPAGTGLIVAMEWDFEGHGDYPLAESGFENGGALSRMTVSASHPFSQPGTYFPVLRVTSQRQGDTSSPYARIVNLSRVRVLVP